MGQAVTFSVEDAERDGYRRRAVTVWLEGTEGTDGTDGTSHTSSLHAAE
ncbi:hypothetical protein [Streptomyces sp. NBC_01508]